MTHYRDILELVLTFIICLFLTFVSPPQARNIAVYIEFKDSDEDEAQPLKVHLTLSVLTLDSLVLTWDLALKW